MSITLPHNGTATSIAAARSMVGTRPYRRKNLLGMTFARWSVIRDLGVVDEKYNWECQCLCGSVKQISGAALLSGDSKSCGCLARDSRAANGSPMRRHGMKQTRIYKAWRSMRQRCRLVSCQSYQRYGGRGISVCSRWQTFESFFSDMGHPKDGESLDRIDNDGNYCPENCRWADAFTQCRNKSNNKIIGAFGEVKNLSAWAEDGRCKTNLRTLTKRLLGGWENERAISAPTLNRGPRMRHAEKTAVTHASH